MVKVLFVCLGNICRSPMAEAVFMDKVRQAGLADRISADSAGTGDWHTGQPPHYGTRRVLAEKGVEYEHRARTLQRTDFDDFDLILTMDEANYETVARQKSSGKAEVRRLMEFAPDSGYREVPDPYYDGNFALTYELVDQAASGLLAHLRSKL